LERNSYIGKSNDPYVRYYQHLRDKVDSYKSRWIKTLLRQGLLPDLQILEPIDVLVWKEKERDWIKFYRNCKYKVVNETEGGEGHGGWNAGICTPQETRKKISNSLKGRNTWSRGKSFSESARAKLRGRIPWNKGKHLPEEMVEKMKTRRPSDESRRKMSEAHKGKPNHQTGRHHTEATKKLLRKLRKGKKASEETLKKMSEAQKKIGNKPPSNKGKFHSQETKEKISRAHMGMHFSDEHRRHISEAKKGCIPWNKGI